MFIVSEPNHAGRSYQISTMAATARYTPPGQWQTNTPMKDGSWWEAWQSWLTGYSSGKVKPPSMGNKEYAPIHDAPGNYVMMQ
jgi:polyhydroxyalkanoate synthase